ncbi:hypothetical protein C8Q78DRAFT_990844 [Trametes maxima]|nr:hypothetical protein C8Q78DRAFT_990844 [Trametes maxima]
MSDATWTAVQQAFLIDEIVRNILVHLPSVGCSKTLARCARVSSALSEPALDILWSRMTGLSPLCQLLPVLSNSARESTLDDGSIPCRSIKDEDWSRFMHYARRVRKLHYHCREDPSERLRQSTFAALVRRAARVGAPLLPRLEELSWLQFSQDITHYLHFVSPSLRRITVYVQVGVATVPDVEELCLEGIELPHSLESLQAFKRLRNLHLGSVTAPVAVILSYCSAMPNLSSLSADLTGSHPPSDLYASHIGQARGKDGPSLNALQILRVAGSPSSIEELFNGISSPTLHAASLAISTHEHDNDGGRRCVAHLSARFAASLHTVRVQYTRMADRTPTDARPFAQYARPLFLLRGLRECTLAIEDPAPVSMEDADVRAMAEAWPALVSLDVSAMQQSGTTGTLPCVTALEAFAQHCPDLVSLRVPVRQDVVALDAWDNTCEIPHAHGLRSLWLSGVWFAREDSRRVMRWLRHIFTDVDLLPMLRTGVLHSEGAPDDQ